MHRRAMRDASRNRCTAQSRAHFCSELIRACAVLTKFLTHLNKRGGFDRRVFTLPAYAISKNAVFPAAKSQMIASRLS